MAAPQLEIPYFKSVCHRVLQTHLQLLGFTPITVGRGGIEDPTIAVYSNGEILLRFSYWPEDFPNYNLMVGLAFSQGRRHPVDSGVGLWSAMPQNKQEVWRFRSEQELETVLCHMRDDVLPTYAEPLWSNPQLLLQLINRSRSERSAKGEVESVERRRQQAEAAFRAGKFRDVVRIYSEFSPVDLTPTDRKRFDLAQRKLL